ncbi:hypothetical protein DNTS_009910 [Danionella cerebrum]|uniref:SKI/SNO/DAC domain-containing protein n=1 Tax=Danionella cerebrum TaxID=2873325 RepID=A0A553RDP5_9TELE|nr:hypothetical protein DNTS_009910 [Danionella translucida]
MGDLESGFEEMQGVKLGYLVIKGKQMFALSQVFTDLLKNIPRTTVHKRMDHLNVKKHHCDLEELRKLKAINSIAFHAAKCTLISREDVEALYFSCKTERVFKSHKKRQKTEQPAERKHEDNTCICEESEFWKEKVWLSLHGVPQTFSFKNKGIRLDAHSNLPQFYSKSFTHDYQSETKSASLPFKNYETDKIPENCVTFHQKHTFIRHAVNRQSLFCQSAIAEQAKHQCNTDLLYKRRRKREGTARPFWSRSRHSHSVLVVPKCCKAKAHNGSFCGFHHLEPGLYVEPRRAGHENCSSDTESSCISERVNNDSDFGSGSSTTSNSVSSGEEEDSLSDSSDVSSDEESSSQSDSSSVSSQVSIQSIRFRRARISSLNTKTPLLLQPTFHYRTKSQSIPTSQGVATILDRERTGKTQQSNFRDHEDNICRVQTSFSNLREKQDSKDPTRLEFSIDPKTSECNKFKDPGLTSNTHGNKVFPKQTTADSTNKCSQALLSNWVPDKEKTPCKSPDSPLSLLANSKRETKNTPKPPPNPIKTEEEHISTNVEGNGAIKIPPFSLNNVKIKVEDTFDDHEYANQPLGFNNDVDFQEDGLKAMESSGQKNSKDEFTSLFSEEREYENVAKVRKNRAMLLGRQIESSPPKLVSKTDLSTRYAGKYASSTEDCTGSNKRKRTNTSLGCLKKPFRFIENFPSPPSLVIGKDGDLSPAYSLNSLRSNQQPHRSHPVWRWQIGNSVVPPPPNHKFRKASGIP